jgi:hypothetical protein
MEQTFTTPVNTPANTNNINVANAGNGANNNVNNAVHINNMNQLVLDKIRNFFQIIQWRLLLRMVLIFILFVYNKGIKLEKKVLIAGTRSAVVHASIHIFNYLFRSYGVKLLLTGWISYLSCGQVKSCFGKYFSSPFMFCF